MYVGNTIDEIENMIEDNKVAYSTNRSQMVNLGSLKEWNLMKYRYFYKSNKVLEKLLDMNMDKVKKMMKDFNSIRNNHLYYWG